MVIDLLETKEPVYKFLLNTELFTAVTLDNLQMKITVKSLKKSVITSRDTDITLRFCLFGWRLYVPVNNFSVMSVRDNPKFAPACGKKGKNQSKQQ